MADTNTIDVPSNIKSKINDSFDKEILIQYLEILYNQSDYALHFD